MTPIDLFVFAFSSVNLCGLSNPPPYKGQVGLRNQGRGTSVSSRK
jgi:hypothetical protein